MPLPPPPPPPPGYLGIDQAECESKGCCWSPVDVSVSFFLWLICGVDGVYLVARMNLGASMGSAHLEESVSLILLAETAVGWVVFGVLSAHIPTLPPCVSCVLSAHIPTLPPYVSGVLSAHIPTLPPLCRVCGNQPTRVCEQRLLLAAH